MPYFMRWKPGALPGTGRFEQYQYFEFAKLRWVDCDSQLYAHFLSKGVVWMNPAFDPAEHLAALKVAA